LTGISAGFVNISYTLTNGCAAMRPFLVDLPVTALVNVTRTITLTGVPAPDTLCENTLVTFKTHPTNGGLTPYYEWLRFDTVKAAGYADSFVYMPIHGDVIYCKMIVSGVCAISDTARDTVTFDIDSNKVPLITITKLGAPDTLQYVGQMITFYTSLHYGGTSPAYQWYNNGVAVPGATGPVYTAAVYDNDTILCTVAGNPPCAPTTPATGISNVIVIVSRLGVNAISNTNKLSLFPNPNNGTLVLSGSVNATANNKISIEVDDMLGRMIYSGTAMPVNGILHEQITLGNNVADGSYLLHVNSESGNEVFHFVIAK
jgi:hypothetical protein